MLAPTPLPPAPAGLGKADRAHTCPFGFDNAKLAGTGTATFSIPAGHTCPGARDCHAWFDRDKHKLVNGPHQKYRCFAASMEARWTSVRSSVDRNLRLLKAAGSAEAMVDLIEMSLPSAAWRNIRIHVNGDFFSSAYFIAWAEVARRNPRRLFYGYTKSLHLWVKHRVLVPPNLLLTASEGGLFDHLIEPNGLRKATVIYHPEEAEGTGMEIDHDDSHARDPQCGDFYLLLHGSQVKGGKASAALKRMCDEGINYSYPRGKNRKIPNIVRL